MIKQLSVITEEEQKILDGQKGIDRKIYTEKKDMVVDCGRLLKKGKLIEIRPHTRFVRFPKHRHNYVEVIYMCKGATTHIIDGNQVVLEAGDLLFLNQNAVQEILPAGKEDIAVNFIILPQFFDTAFQMMGTDRNLLYDFLIGSLSENSPTTSYLHFHVSEVLPVQNLVENMVWSLLHDSPNKRSSNQITFGLLMMQLAGSLDKMEAGENQYEQDFVVTVLNYIENNYKDGSLSELASATDRDVYWMSREIKRLTGKTYKELLLTKRMNQASYLLSNTKLPISEIVQIVGYDNSSYFFRKFRERYGVSPKEYREHK